MTSVALTQNETFGVILLGNSGAGKSFLLNALIGQNKFASEFSAASVTHDVLVLLKKHLTMLLGYFTM